MAGQSDAHSSQPKMETLNSKACRHGIERYCLTEKLGAPDGVDLCKDTKPVRLANLDLCLQAVSCFQVSFERLRIEEFQMITLWLHGRCY
jgi:hypothetical protein